MRYGFVLPKGDARTAADFAYEAEQAGWDAFFVWDAPWGVDPWVALAAAAMRTQRIRLGTMITPVSRRRPWKLASETATLDNLSGGRVILSVGLGALDTGFAEFGEVTDRKQRAELMDEGLEIIGRLWKGEKFTFEGKHYHIRTPDFLTPPPPVQQPRIPIWMVGVWPIERSMQRVLRYDGWLPNWRNPETGNMERPGPEVLRVARDWMAERKSPDPAPDIIIEGETPGDDPARAASIVLPWMEAGATWWIEADWVAKDLAPVLARVRSGPPQV
jgi:alkanesulfonate monooxygenase SsuD/methylene tetrahydromethanopterin reductase-like flavin-dependent oxidoreductase (luciferase family)